METGEGENLASFLFSSAAGAETPLKSCSVTLMLNSPAP